MSKALVNAKQVLQPHSGDERPAARGSHIVGNDGGSLALVEGDCGRGSCPSSFHATVLVGLSLAVPVSREACRWSRVVGGGIVLARGDDAETEYFSGGRCRGCQVGRPTRFGSHDAGSAPQRSSTFRSICRVLCPPPTEAATGSGVGEALPSASGFTSGSGTGRGSGSGSGRGSGDGNYARTSIFGAEGTGNKLVYVFDRSASTDGYQGRPLAAAKRELIASLDDLQDIHQFQIVFYNERPTVFNPSYPQPPRMLFGDSPTKRLAKNFVRGIVSAGSTRHLEALKLALGMRPDVIFFLTDAGEPQLSANQVDEVRQRNLRVGAQINTIEFGAGPNPGGRNFLVRLADENGGQYVYVDVTRLPSADASWEQ